MRKKSTRRILVVDDEPLVRWSIAETLRLHGYDVAEAEDARGALAAVIDPARAPDAMLLDLKLPDSADLELLAAIRRVAPALPVILMTAFGTAEVFEEARRLGVYTVLDKPFDLDDLDLLIERAIDVGQPS